MRTKKRFPDFTIFATAMKTQKHILMISGLLLLVICYTQVFHKIIANQGYSFVVINDTDNAEEPLEKTTTEENTNETDQDEDPFRHVEMMNMAIGNPPMNLKIENYSVCQFGYYPEIVSPPPQA